MKKIRLLPLYGVTLFFLSLVIVSVVTMSGKPKPDNFKEISTQSQEEQVPPWLYKKNFRYYEPGTIIVKVRQGRLEEFNTKIMPALKNLFFDLKVFSPLLQNETSEPDAMRIGLDRILLVSSASIRDKMLSSSQRDKFVDRETNILFERLKDWRDNFEYIQLNKALFLKTEDDYYPIMWHLDNNGQRYPTYYKSYKTGSKGADINAEDGWKIDKSQGGKDLVVGVVDSGLDLTHQDIRGNVWVNSGEDLNRNGAIEEQEKNGRDDDRNGYIDDFYGYDFGAAGENGVLNPDNDPTDDEGHGTHVSGIIAGMANNKEGVTGVAYNGKILSAKVFPNGYESVVSRAVIYAVNNGAKVINMSLGRESEEGEEGMISDAIAYAKARNVAVLVAAGNETMNAAYSYPANVAEAITISATNSKDNKAIYANFGMKIAVGAPGTDILSLRSNAYIGMGIYRRNYLVISGTSMATPVSTGIAALIRANRPEFTPEQVRQVLQYSADDLGKPGFDELFGYGRVNLKKALEVNSIPEAQIYNISYTQEVMNNNSTISGRVAGQNLERWDLSYASVDQNNWQELSSGSTPVDGVIYSWRSNSVSPGWYYLRLRGIDRSGTEAVDMRKIQVY